MIYIFIRRSISMVFYKSLFKVMNELTIRNRNVTVKES